MVTRHHLLNTLNDTLAPPERMTDTSNNGLQVEGAADIERVVFAVDASMALFQKAADWNAQAIVVHHGISWGPGFRTITGNDARRLSMLLANDLNLFAYHLPLDCHPTLGNNAQIAKRLDVRGTTPFGTYGDIEIGVRGSLPTPMTLQTLTEHVNACLQTRTALVAENQERLIRTVAIVSGGGADLVTQCPDRDIDCLITGEIAHQHIHPAHEAGVPVITAGHYATETWGLKALLEILAERLDLDCRFIDLPTGY